MYVYISIYYIYRRIFHSVLKRKLVDMLQQMNFEDVKLSKGSSNNKTHTAYSSCMRSLGKIIKI